MEEDEHPQDPMIAAAVAELAAGDPSVAEAAEAALDWLVGEQDLASITQEQIQYFVWYSLPLKWAIDFDDKLEIVAALAAALELLGLPRYAQICRSDVTRSVLEAYETDPRKGRRAFNEADIASGIRPPDLPEFGWGSTMGTQENFAYSSTAEFLELAVAGGDFVPGAKGWKRRQQEVARRHLNEPRRELAGRPLIEVIRNERMESWLRPGRSETRRVILAPIAPRLLLPIEIPGAAADDALPEVRWLLGELEGGVALTQTGNLNQRFVQAAAERFGWDYHRPPRSEDELFDLWQIRDRLQEIGLVRRSKRTLVLTTKGRALRVDPDGLWRWVARSLLDRGPFEAFTGELVLSILLAEDSVSHLELSATIARAVGEEGFRETRTSRPASEHDVGRSMHVTLNLCRALGVLSSDGGWPRHAYALTKVGRAVALEALSARAIGPRTGPWG